MIDAAHHLAWVVDLSAATELPSWLRTSGLLGAVAFGLLSAFIPPLNAEVYAAAVPVIFPGTWAEMILAMTAGFMAGKVSHLVAARRGADAITRRREVRIADTAHRDPAERSRLARARSWMADQTARAIDTLDRPVLGPAVVGFSAFTGLPPFALVVVAAGARKTNPTVVIVVGTLGCLARFMLTAWVVSRATG